MKPDFRYRIAAALCAVICLAAGCAVSPDRTDAAVPEGNAVQGMLNVKWTPELADRMALLPDAGRQELADSLLPDLRVQTADPVFSGPAAFEPRTRAAGLNQWYEITYEADPATVKSLAKGSLPAGVLCMEPPQTPAPQKFTVLPLSRQAAAATKSVTSDLNDPFAGEQWYLNNDGTPSLTAVKGFDLELLGVWPAWRGTSDVTVAVLDGGILTSHPDLAGAMWVNEAERNGRPGVDDDGNGYVDDVYGYNFLGRKADMTPNDHATHVAGLIGAVNNNGIGIASVAGGDNGVPGVRLMACQILGDEEDQVNYGNVVAKAFKYAADNGAVICSNSWDYSPDVKLPALERDAIRYFIRNAGTDANGVQTGPMKGGLVLFAAGNFATSHETYPAAFEEVLSVTGITSGGLVGEYANYGTWVDLTAFGGTAGTGLPADMILSTTADGWYGYAVGTSMAAPQVAGVAALLLQRFGGEGFTPEQLKAMLLQTKDGAYDRNPAYLNMLGNGLVSARQAMKTYPEGWVPPVKPVLSSVADYYSLLLKWPASIQSDSLTVPKYRIYWQKVGRDTPVEMKTWQLNGAEMQQDTLTMLVPLLEPATAYEFSVVAVDDWHMRSEIGSLKASTRAFSAPEVVQPLTAWYTKELGTETIVPLADVFSSEYPLALDLEVTPGGVAEGTLDGSVLVLRAVGDGRATVTLTAEDRLGGTAVTSCPVVVHTTGAFSGVFPTVVSKTLHVSLYSMAEARVLIEDRKGRTVFDERITAGIFSPAGIDVSALQSGVYKVTVSGGSREETYTVLKQ